MSWIGKSAPVEVSLWVRKITLALGWAASADSTSSTVATRPHSTLTVCTVTPYAWQMARQRSPNFPPSTTIASSPAERRFTAAASMAPEPEHASVRAGWVVPRCSCMRRVVSRKYWRYSSVRWWMSGLAIASSTSDGTSVGPGVNSTRFMVLPAPWKTCCGSVRVRLLRRLLFLVAAKIRGGLARFQSHVQHLIHGLDELELDRFPDVLR